MLLPCPAPAADPRAPLPKAADSTGKRRDALWPLDCSAQARGPGLLARGRKKPVPGPGTGRQGECSRGRDDSASCFGKGRTAGTDNSQAGRMRLLWGCVWGLGSTEPQAWQHRPEPPPAAEQSGLFMVTRGPGLKTGIFHEVTRFDRVLTQRLTAEVCLANQPFIQSAIHSSFSPSLHLTVCLSFHLATLPFFHTSTLAPIHPSIHPLICAFVHLSVCLFIQQGFMEPWLCQVRC